MKQFIYSLVFFMLLLLAVHDVRAQFLYNMPITITNNENKTVVGWQVPLYINTAALVTAGHMQTDGRDIRFSKDCAGTKMLNFFIDSGMNSTKTKIWVKIDTLYPMADRLIYMLYGNTTVTTASTYATFNGPYSATDSVVPANTNTVSDCQRGMKFRATRDIIVSRFGKFTPDNTTRWVTLFDFTTQAKLEQIQVSGPAATYSYQSLSNHLWIKANVDYILALHNASGHMYYYTAPGQGGPYIQYGDMRYCNSCNQNTFPTTVLSNNMYGVPDFEYYTVDTNNITNIPTYSLSGSGTGNAEITLGDMPYICPGETQALVPYSSTIGNPQSYDITWSAAANSAGFINTSNEPLAPQNIVINTPGSLALGTYTGTLTINNICGAGKSYPVQVIVGGNVNIKTQGHPEDTVVCPRDPAAFTVNATGPGLSYQWQGLLSGVWTDITNGGNYSGANTPLLQISQAQNSDNNNEYRCIVSSNCASPVTSSAGILKVNVDPIVSTDPADVVATPGQTVTFTVAIQGNARYQWQAAVPGGVFSNINDGAIYNGVKTNKLTVTGVAIVQDNYSFRCVLYNAGNCIAPGDTSNAAILTVVPPETVSSIHQQELTVVYPNPVTGAELYIRTGKSGKGIEYRITDKAGRIVGRGNINAGGVTTADVRQLAPGIYFAEILDSDGNRVTNTKFTKQ